MSDSGTFTEFICLICARVLFAASNIYAGSPSDNLLRFFADVATERAAVRS